MKLRKTIAAAAAAALAAAAICTVPASAISDGATVADFEDGDCSFVYMNVDDGADNSVISVESYDGSNQLKIDVQDHTMVPKVWFDVKKMMDVSNYTKIKTIEFDLTLVPKNSDEAIGWAGGAVGASGKYGDQVDPAWSQGDWSCDDNNCYEAGLAAKTHVTRKFLLPTHMFTETSESPFFGLMRWAGETDYVLYFDNIQCFDGDGNALPFIGNAAAAAPAAEAAPAAAPASDAATTSTGTGNTAAAAIASVMAIAGVAAAASRKRK